MLAGAESMTTYNRLVIEEGLQSSTGLQGLEDAKYHRNDAVAPSRLGRAICTCFVHLNASVRGIDIKKDQLQECKPFREKSLSP